jgi:polyhydroxyalkanoate synthase
MVSRKNPEPDGRGLDVQDHRTLGFLAAFDVVNAAVPNQKVHAVGYFFGRTLLSIAAAAFPTSIFNWIASIDLRQTASVLANYIF